MENYKKLFELRAETKNISFEFTPEKYYAHMYAVTQAEIDITDWDEYEAYSKKRVQKDKLQSLLNLHSKVNSILSSLESIEDKSSEAFILESNTLSHFQSLVRLAEDEMSPEDWEYYSWLPF